MASISFDLRAGRTADDLYKAGKAETLKAKQEYNV